MFDNLTTVEWNSDEMKQKVKKIQFKIKKKRRILRNIKKK
jgi:hypothetical protein